MFQGISDMFHWMGWMMTNGLFYLYGKMFNGYSEGFNSFLNSILKSSELKNMMTSISKTITILLPTIFLAYIVYNYMTFNQEGIKKGIKNYIYVLVFLLILPVLSTTSLSITKAIVPPNVEENTVGVSLANGFIWEEDVNGNIVDRSTGVIGKPGEENEGNIAMNGDNCSASVCYDINELTDGKKSNYRFHYINPILSFIVMLVLIGITFLAIIRLFMLLFNLIIMFIIGSINAIQIVWGGGDGVKVYLVELFKNLMGILLTFLVFFLYPVILNIIGMTNAGIVITLALYFALGMFMLDGPQSIVSMFGVDVGQKSVLGSIVGANQAMSLAGKVGSGAKDTFAGKKGADGKRSGGAFKRASDVTSSMATGVTRAGQMGKELAKNPKETTGVIKDSVKSKAQDLKTTSAQKVGGAKDNFKSSVGLDSNPIKSKVEGKKQNFAMTKAGAVSNGNINLSKANDVTQGESSSNINPSKANDVTQGGAVLNANINTGKVNGVTQIGGSSSKKVGVKSNKTSNPNLNSTTPKPSSLKSKAENFDKKDK